MTLVLVRAGRGTPPRLPHRLARRRAAGVCPPLPTGQIIGTLDAKWNEFSISSVYEIFFAIAIDLA
jgi:hypothetical protein